MKTEISIEEHLKNAEREFDHIIESGANTIRLLELHKRLVVKYSNSKLDDAANKIWEDSFSTEKKL